MSCTSHFQRSQLVVLVAKENDQLLSVSWVAPNVPTDSLQLSDPLPFHALSHSRCLCRWQSQRIGSIEQHTTGWRRKVTWRLYQYYLFKSPAKQWTLQSLPCVVGRTLFAKSNETIYSKRLQLHLVTFNKNIFFLPEPTQINLYFQLVSPFHVTKY